MFRWMIFFALAFGSLGPTPAAAQAPAESARASREQLLALEGVYRFDDGSEAMIEFLEDIGQLTVIEFPSGRLRALFPAGTDQFTTGPSAAMPEPVEARWAFEGDRLIKTADGSAQVGRRLVLREEAVRFTNGPVTLEGTLTLPAGDGPFPAVILLHGGGAQTRDFWFINRFFARRGVAVLAYDKRGAGASTGGDWRTASAVDLAGDALAGLAFLQRRSDIDPRRIGLYGASNGGWVAPQAAALAPDKVAFVIVRSGSGLPERENQILEAESDLRTNGFGDEAVARMRALHRLEIDQVRNGGRDWNGLRAALAQASSEPWFRFARLPGSILEDTPANRPAIDAFIGGERRRYIDPADLWPRVRAPVLVQLGGRDVYIPAIRSQEIIRDGLSRGGNRDATVILYPDGDHGLFESPTGQMRDIPRVTRFAPGYLTDLDAWISAKVLSRPGR